MLPIPNWEDLPLTQKVAQMVVVRASGHLFDPQIQYPDWEPPAAVLRHWLRDLRVGGVILLGGTAAEVGLRTQQLQEWAAIPLLIAADIEEGVGQRFAGAVWFPPPMAVGAIAQQNLSLALTYAEQMGQWTAQEALAIGINWLLAPVVDVNNNPVNPVINVRAWAETPAIVSQLTTAFIRGAQRYPVLTAAKHFPGHGDTAVDSHLDLPVLSHSLSRLQEIELPPFQSAIASGVDAVMSAHLQIPAIDPRYPATLSHASLTTLLRQKLGFEGLIVTDALIMGAITRRYGATEAVVLAVEAGADILLMPVDPVSAIQAVCEAVEAERIPLARIHASLERIWQAKQKVCPSPSGGTSHAWEQTAPPPIQLNQLAQPDAIATATGILQASTQVHAPSGFVTPAPAQSLRNLIIVDDALNCPFLGRQAPAIVLPRQLGYSLQIVDHATPKIAPDLQEHASTLLQLFIRGNPFRGSVGSQLAQEWLQFLLKTHQLQALILYGSPYLLEQFLPQLPDDLPYVFTYGQMPAAQTIALEALFPAGRSVQQSENQQTDENQANGHQASNPQAFTD